jgi:hypothetical protein
MGLLLLMPTCNLLKLLAQLLGLLSCSGAG